MREKEKLTLNMNKLQELIDELHSWQEETFPHADAISKLHHLAKEVPELIEELKGMDDKAIRMEYADCFLLLFGSAAMHGLSAEEICDAIKEKLEINRSRTWGKPDENGVVEHIK
jgi:NTP pyrophosphatase (non-canonical NTP hydrolase)